MSLIIPSRRGFLMGAGILLAAPAIVRVASLMPVKSLPVTFPLGIFSGFGAPQFMATIGSLYLRTDGDLTVMTDKGWAAVTVQP